MRVASQRSRKPGEQGRGACVLLGILLFAASAWAQESPGPASSTPPAPPSNLTVVDPPNDAGRSLVLNWTPSADDGTPGVKGYQLHRAKDPGGPWDLVDSVNAGVATYTDQSVKRDIDYFYRVTATGPFGLVPARSVTGPVRAEAAVVQRWPDQRTDRPDPVLRVRPLLHRQRPGWDETVRAPDRGHRRDRGGDRARHRDGPLGALHPGHSRHRRHPDGRGTGDPRERRQDHGPLRDADHRAGHLSDPVHDRRGDGQSRVPAGRKARPVRPEQRALHLARAVRLRRRGDRHHDARQAGRPHLHGRVLRRVAVARRDRLRERRHPGGRARPTSTSFRSSSSPATTR